jgi:hypothetical protein
MAHKIVINGEEFLFNQDHRPMSEALALEKTTGMPYGQWEQELAAGSIRALAGFVWLIWRRDGRETDFGAILSGEIEVDLAGLMESLAQIADDAEEGNELGPTLPSVPTPGRTPTTPPGTSPSSPRSTGSGRGRSAS